MTWKTALVALLSSLAFFGLAVLGAGGWNDIVSKPPLVAVLLIGAALAIAGLFTQGNLDTGVKEDRGNRWVLRAFGILGLLMAWLPAYTDRMNIATIGGDTVRWIGVALFAVGGVLRVWPVFTLGKRFSGLVAIQQGHQLVTTGPYAIVRHPSYLGMLLFVLGWGLAFRSLAGVALAVLMVVPLMARIRAEEAMLSKEFGAAYESYRARTSRLVPGVY
ncbi:methyltransferase family protein [Bradyrhizobium sp. SYSU BS000235]|uniref:methyltransferase family protein n=1 Tax=Bradyrhizobium sp. SYSU BS000235 TaxID=3411332 RepID=UPI003C7522C1